MKLVVSTNASLNHALHNRLIGRRSDRGTLFIEPFDRAHSHSKENPLPTHYAAKTSLE